ncbi:39S ribosomal protein L35, mitochondrial [Rhinatrema bivittatum]|uniref:39S ribosomal protein L35, mitochondrial n=1 Tax=Rhinatrema bivittatum TaxID=194408 RepID=UPI00112D6D03|nr:39S ribosomal protein L35, mitochondrial [Rhinatrema bivittatum]
MEAARAGRVWLKRGGDARCRQLLWSWVGFRYCSGGAALQRHTAETGGFLKPLKSFFPLTYNGISCGERLASGLSSLCFKPVQAPAIFATTKLSSATRKLTHRPNISILNSVTPLLPSIFQQPLRTLTYFGFRKGKRKTVKAVVKRFLRLHCGLWLRKRAGYKKRLWKKSAARKKRLREEVFCNRTQSILLDKMTTSFWKRRNWFVNDPYQKYHDRTNLKV